MSEKYLENKNGNELSALEFHEQQIISQCRVQALSFAETGKLLKAIRDGKEYEARGFKSFAEYMDDACETVFPFKSGQAYKYIRVYEKYGARLEQFGTVSLDILDMFRDIPAEDFEKLADENNLEKMSVKEAEELKRQLEKATEQISFWQSAAKEKEGELTSAKGRIENLENEIDELQSRPVDVTEPDENVINELAEKKAAEQASAHKKEIKELKKNIKELEKQAKSADDVKSDYENRLKELDEKLNASKAESDRHIRELEEQVKKANRADAALIEYKFYFSEMQNNLKKFIGVLDQISDADKKEKFKGAAVKFLNGVLEELGK
ncbi:MAG: hypothetical protein NC395_07295 [Prevotella sp.]|nr:hypothetical protein [Prevotella sp.]